MSVKIMTKVWEQAPCRENSLIVLLALADWSNDDGISWPSMQKLADKARVDRRSAQRIVRKLVKDGLLKIEEGGGRAKQHRYQIETAALCRPLENSDFQNSDIGDTKTATLETERATLPTETATQVSPDPLVEPLEKPSIDPLVVREQKFWDELKTNPAYRHIDFEVECGRMRAWLALPKNKGRKMSPGFVLNWLNKIDPPLNGNGRSVVVDPRPPVEEKHPAEWYIKRFKAAIKLDPAYTPHFSWITDKQVKQDVLEWWMTGRTADELNARNSAPLNVKP